MTENLKKLNHHILETSYTAQHFRRSRQSRAGMAQDGKGRDLPSYYNRGGKHTAR